MKRILLLLSLILVGISLPLSDAEAKRLGSGRSIGMQRDMSAVRPAAPPAQQQLAPAHPSAPGAAPAAPQPKRSWVGPLAGLAAGLGLGALLAGSGFGGMLDSLFTVLLVVLAAVFVMRLVSAFRRQPKPEEALQYAGVGGPGMAPIPDLPDSQAPQTVAPSAANLPAGFDAEGFLRVAKVNYIRLQAAYDTANLDDLREFTSPELFAEIKLDLNERGTTQQKTDVVTLNAELLEVTTQGNQHVASVRFHGLIREEAQGGAQPVDEMWHLAKPVDGSRGWVVAGIQQQ